MKNFKKIIIIALAAHGQGLSGGDRIFIEFARIWSRDNQVLIYTTLEGQNMCRTLQLKSGKNLEIKVIQTFTKNFGLNYIEKILKSLVLALRLQIKNQPTLIYSASEFWMDSLAGLIIKLRSANCKWVATWFQTAPNPLKGFSQVWRKNPYRLSALLYWLSQFPIKPIIEKNADYVLVNNRDERGVFPSLNKQRKVIVVYGAVDLDKIDSYKKKLLNQKKVYDAVFQGRFHPQKGVVELIDIWRLVVKQKPQAKLIMIGDGPLKKAVEIRIRQLKLEANITLSGYLFDGFDKYKIFAQSKVVLHPSFFDSGGMACAEAMAFGLPAVGFNLPAFKSYYPEGMVKVEIGNLKQFASMIVQLLLDLKKRQDLGAKAEKMIYQNWSFEKRALAIWQKIS